MPSDLFGIIFDGGGEASLADTNVQPLDSFVISPELMPPDTTPPVDTPVLPSTPGPADVAPAVGALSLVADVVAAVAPVLVAALLPSPIAPDRPGAGLLPQPQPAGPTGPPSTPSLVAAAPEIPPNWWEIANPPFIDVPQLPIVNVPPIAATLGDVLANLLNPANLGDIGAQPNPLAGLSTPITNPDIIVTGSTDAPVSATEIVVTGSARAPDTLVAPDVVPLGFPELGLDPFIDPSGLPHFAFSEPGFIPKLLPAVITSGNPLADPLVGGGVSTAPTLPFASPVGTPTPVIAPIGIPVGNPIGVPIISPVGFISPIGSPDSFADPAAQAQAAAERCVGVRQQTKERRRQKKRSKCHEGTYIELSHGLIKHAKRVIPCR